ncbi:hypothetical protein RintRC_0371 [Richelia intracellularis]|nr:hypothetical protein RintRC_0371 [Richelia intracellularis]
MYLIDNIRVGTAASQKHKSFSTSINVSGHLIDIYSDRK